MPEKKTSGIIVPVPELSREARCALAFSIESAATFATDVSDVGPMPDHKARPELLKVAAFAIERAVDGAVSRYREAMREKYSSPTTVGEEVDAERAAAAEKEVAISGMEQAHKKPGIFGR